LDFLRVVMCGSVDDGKSTLIGRLLYDAGLVTDDQIAAIAAIATASQGGLCGPEGLDFSLLLDGLQTERDQGVTIDAGYRYFKTTQRIFSVVDSPGAEQYTRNTATAASAADAAIVVVDCRAGVLPQTRRHLAILSFFGVARVAVIVNKMDLLDFDEAAFRRIVDACREAARIAGLRTVDVLPTSALFGDNVVRRSARLNWYNGPTLLEWLERVETNPVAADRPFRMPVQWINRGIVDFRGYGGLIVSGRIRVNDPIVVMPSGLRTTVARIVTMDGDRQEANAGQSVTLTLNSQIDVESGAILASVVSSPEAANHFRARIVWFAETPMIPGRSYLMQIGTESVSATVTDLKYRIDRETQASLAAETLKINEIAVCNIMTDRAVAFDAYAQDRNTGAFILIDRDTSATIGAGTIEFALRRSANLTWHEFKVDRATRASLKGQQPAILWFTGLSAAGKSTIADLLERRLAAQGRHTFLLDGDNIRHGLNKNLGFTEADRVENVRRVAEVARLMADAGLIVIVSLISPFQRERALAREIAGDVDFLEIFIDAPLALCEQRDPKGLYAKARAGLLMNFTGVDSPYEAPKNPDLQLNTEAVRAEALVDEVLKELTQRGLV
jgi:bifunctional enzyme CysN/CysC